MLKDRISMIFLRYGHLDVIDGAFVLVDQNGVRTHIPVGSVAENVLQAYVPAIPGKESRKAEPGKEGLLGVEGVNNDLILQGLETALASKTTCQQKTAQLRPITYTDLYEWGISGTANSADNRRVLLRRLGLPPRLSKKELLQILNTLYTYDALNAEIEKIGR